MSVRLLALGALLSGLALAGLGSSPRGSRCESCNVILISIDTLRADHIGAYGYQRPTTPRIDAFAGRAVLFENAISQSAWTRPAHASMLTGLYPSEHGIIGVAGRPALPSSLPTLATVLQEHGYRTAAFTGGVNLSSHFGYDRGFAVYRSPGRRLEDGLADARAWVSSGTGPFFLFLHGFDVHRPYRALEDDRKALGLTGPRPRGMQKLCRRGVTRAELAPHIDEYDAAIRRADRSVGALLDMLDDLGLADRTVVVLTSDHGEEFLEHGFCFHIRALYRETVHVPLVASVPGLPARRVARVVPASASVGPTILDVLGLTGLPGASLRPLLEGQARARALDPYVVSETGARDTRTGRYGRIRSLTSQREKLVYWIDAGRVQYFDLARDPEEKHPILDGPRVQALTAELERWSARRLPVAEPASAPAPPPGLARKLRRLGYVE